VVHRGRKEFLQQFPSIATASASDRIDAPGARSTFERCKLDFSEREKHAPLYALHVDLLGLRREDPSFGSQRADLMHGAVLGPRALLLRFFHPGGDRLITLNLGPDLKLDPSPEPLLAPRAGRRWQRVLSSEDVKYGGSGYAEPHDEGAWFLTAESASVFREEEE
jgi:maltooligosyltrehalose trehalohydrolase